MFPPISAVCFVERQNTSVRVGCGQPITPQCSMTLFLTWPFVGLAVLCCLIDFLPRRIDTLRAWCSCWQTARLYLAGSFDTVNPGVAQKRWETYHDPSEGKIHFQDWVTGGRLEVRAASVFIPWWGGMLFMFLSVLGLQAKPLQDAISRIWTSYFFSCVRLRLLRLRTR